MDVFPFGWGGTQFGSVRFGSARFGLGCGLGLAGMWLRVRLGSSRLGSVRIRMWIGFARDVSIQLGSVRLGSVRLGSMCRFGSVRFGPIRLGSARWVPGAPMVSLVPRGTG